MSDDVQKSGSVDFFSIQNNFSLESCSHDYLTALGSTIALILWSGASDLHSDNLHFGYQDNGSPYIFLCDIEFVLERQFLPHQAHLLSSPHCTRFPVGLALLERQTSPEQISAILKGFVATSLALRGEFGHTIAELLFDESTEHIPIRITLKPTSFYYELLADSKNSGWDLLTSEEKYQLENGDIPYFFRYAKSNHVMFYKNSIVEFTKIKLPVERIHTSKESLFDKLLHEQRLRFGACQLILQLANISGFSLSTPGCKITVDMEKVSYSILNISNAVTRRT